MTARQLYDSSIAPHLKLSVSGCMEWPFARHEKGYGIVFDLRNRRTRRVHRIVWEAFKGAPIGQILHKCDNKSCANIEHLYDGSHDDNVKDALTRQRYKQGAAHYLSSFTQEQVIEILYLAAGKQSANAIAEKFGTARKNICNILSGKTWKSVQRLAL